MRIKAGRSGKTQGFQTAHSYLVNANWKNEFWESLAAWLSCQLRWTVSFRSCAIFALCDRGSDVLDTQFEGFNIG